MPIPVSTVPAARSYLLSAITTQVTAAGLTEPIVEVYDAGPDHDTANDLIIVAGVRRQVKPLALVGNGGPLWRTEDYRIEVIIECCVMGPSATMTAVHNRAYQLLAMVETAVRTDPSLGGLAIQAAPVESESAPSWDDQSMGAHCNITMYIDVQATL